MESVFQLSKTGVNEHLNSETSNSQQQPIPSTKTPKQKRNRVSLNCLSCKKRKIKCDRKQPCDSCIKYGSTCQYQNPTWTRAQQDSDHFNVERLNASSSTESVSEPKKKKKKVDSEVEQPPNLPINSSNDNDVYSQLNFLKSKLKELETNITSQDKSSPASIEIIDPPLPPQPQTQPKKTKKKPIFNFDSYSTNSSNSTFIGINPYNETTPKETMNFYSDYSSVYLQEINRRYNHGPFTWLSFLKKDPALNLSWKFLQHLRSENRSILKDTPRHIKCKPLHHHQPPTKEKTRTSGATSINSPISSLQDPKTNVIDDDFREKAIDRDGYNDLRLYGNIKTNFKQSEVRGGRGGGKFSRLSEECKRKRESAPDVRCATTPGDNLDKINESDKNATSNPNDHIHHVHEHKHKRGEHGKNHCCSKVMSYGKGKIEEELNLIENLKNYLPNQKIIWLSIDFFFEYLYPYLPILDEFEYTKEMERLIGSKGYEEKKIEELNIEKRLDFAFLGVLFIIIRLAHISLISNRSTNNDANKSPQLKYILDNPPDIKLIEKAKLCLSQFDLYRRTSLIVLQLTFLLRLHSLFSPEDGDGADGADSQIYTALSIQMALAIGLNRDGTTIKYDDIKEDEKLQNLHRKLWFFMIICDLIQGYQYGNQLGISEAMYDTRLPFYELGNNNIQNVELEKHVIGTFAYFEKYHYKLVDILNGCLNMKRPLEIAKLTEMISDFEIFLNDNYGILKFFLIPYDEDNYAYPFIKTMKCKNYINMKMFLNMIFYHLYLYYEAQSHQNVPNSKHLAFFYLKKLSSIFYGEFFPYIFQLLYNNHKNFGSSITVDLILNPGIQSMIHKMSQFNFALLIRLKATIYTMRYVNESNHVKNIAIGGDIEYKKKYLKYVKICQLIEKISEICLMAMSRLSQRYYYAWRITKAHSYILENCINNDNFMKFFQPGELHQFLDLEDSQLNEIIKICESNLKKFTTFQKQNCMTSNCNGLDEKNEVEVDFENNEVHNENETTNFTPVETNESSSPKPKTPQSTTYLKEGDVIETNILGFPPTEAVVSNPLTNESWSFLDDFKFMNSEEIDKLWISMKLKYDKKSTTNEEDQQQQQQQSQQSQPSNDVGLTRHNSEPYYSNIRDSPIWSTNSSSSSLQQINQQNSPISINNLINNNNKFPQQQQQQQQQFQSSQVTSQQPNLIDVEALKDFDLFDSLPLEEMLGIINSNN
ncbi:hypothetical protein KGF54_000913 [Candida jiufengensis]|uniref:uncharacterized protein n=1 Tax=Candida jiufengensis TaxID=497108 RepID=UPI0022241868|nr:uncharacterized protein KGF54_000913 [Candida jiufengensis]KAI5956438.1 hypothetical protein KGF54_000913 [Candida jiufengensis]